MINILNNSDRNQLEAAYRITTVKRTANSINALLLLDDGYSADEAAIILRLDRTTVSRYLQRFRDSGLSSFLETPFLGGISKLSFEEIKTLENYVDNNLCERTDQVVDYVKSNFDIDYTRSGMSSILRRIGFVFKKPIIIPGKADASAQESFVDYYSEIRKTMGDKDKIYFLDGVHPQFNSVSGYGWIRKGQNKSLKSNTGRQRVNLNGALDPESLEVIIRSDKTLNAESTIELFKMIEQENSDAEKIALIVDNAPYYYNGDIIEYINNSTQLELIFLPTYSPNLNLIERVWGFMKRTVILNKYYADFSEFKKAIGDFFQKLPRHFDKLETLLTEDFQTINSSP